MVAAAVGAVVVAGDKRPSSRGSYLIFSKPIKKHSNNQSTEHANNQRKVNIKSRCEVQIPSSEFFLTLNRLIYPSRYLSLRLRKSESKNTIMAGKKFSIKKLRLRGRAARRRQALKVAPQTKGLKVTIAQSNLDVIRSLESKIKAAQA